MTTQREILIATSNRGKLREIRDGLGNCDVRWRTLADYAGVSEPDEESETFLGNAIAKARYYSVRIGLWTLADDSGLQVDALGGAPGVRSARYAGLTADDAANNAKLIAALKDVPPERRTARFCCAVALVDGDIVLATAEGAVEGLIIDEPRGCNGFGYDPHFLVPELGITTAEMPPEQKNRISHRGQALRLIRPRIVALLGEV